MKNLKINKRKIASILLAMGISLTSFKGNAEIISYNNKATLKDGREVMVYFTTGNTENDYAYVSYDGLVGYLPLSNINTNNMIINNDYHEIMQELTINTDIANVYNTPNINEKVNKILHKNDKVLVVAKSNTGWYIVSNNDFTGFINENAFINHNKKTRMVKINGNNVNIRTTPKTNTKDNIIGTVNTNELFKCIKHEGKWYLIDYYGQDAYVSDSYSKEIEIEEEEITNIQKSNKVVMAKVLGNNVNIRSMPDARDDNNIIGFADQTDCFLILDKENDWYVIDYLGQYGYIYYKYVEEKEINKEDLIVTKMVYITNDTPLYQDRGSNYMSTLPQYQLASVIKEENNYYKVRVDGFIGYINKKDTKGLTNTFVASDLGRQIVKVYKNNKEVYRAHMISGRKGMQTDMGIFKIGHKLRNYQLTPEINVEKWMQYNDNEGFHDAYWQADNNFTIVAKEAYDAFSLGNAKTYPNKYGSHGCANLKKKDADAIYDIIHIGDNVLVMGPNQLLNNKLISTLIGYYLMDDMEQKVKKLA